MEEQKKLEEDIMAKQAAAEAERKKRELQEEMKRK